MKKNVKFLIGCLVGVMVLSAAYFGAGGGLFQGKLKLTAASYKNDQLGVEFQYKKHNKQQPFVDIQANAWYYLSYYGDIQTNAWYDKYYYNSDIHPLWSIGVPIKPQDGMPVNLDGYGVIRIRAYDAEDVAYNRILSKLEEDVEVKDLKEQTNRKLRTLVFNVINVSGESSTAEALVFGKKYVLNIELRWESTKNNAFQTVLKSISF